MRGAVDCEEEAGSLGCPSILKNLFVLSTKEKENNTMDEQLKYPFEIRQLSGEEGGGYLISFPDLPGCISDGDTIEEAIKNGIDAMNSWI